MDARGGMEEVITDNMGIHNSRSTKLSGGREGLEDRTVMVRVERSIRLV